MSNEKKVPCKCNHCNSTNIIHQVWGRTEFWSCKDCKNEVTYVEPNFGKPWEGYDTKTYGFGADLAYIDALEINLPPGNLISPYIDFDGNINFDDI